MRIEALYSINTIVQKRTVLVSKLYPLFIVEGLQSTFVIEDAIQKDIVNLTELEEEVLATLSFEDGLVRSLVFVTRVDATYGSTSTVSTLNQNGFDDIVKTTLALEDSVLKTLLTNLTTDFESLSSNLSVGDSTIRNVLLVYTSDTESLSSSLSIDDAEFTV